MVHGSPIRIYCPKIHWLYKGHHHRPARDPDYLQVDGSESTRLSHLGTVTNTNSKVRLEYKVDYSGKEVISYSPLGIVRNDQKFTNNLKFIETVGGPAIDETYIMPHGKRRICCNHYVESTVKLQNYDGSKLELIVRVYWSLSFTSTRSEGT